MLSVNLKGGGEGDMTFFFLRKFTKVSVPSYYHNQYYHVYISLKRCTVNSDKKAITAYSKKNLQQFQSYANIVHFTFLSESSVEGETLFVYKQPSLLLLSDCCLSPGDVPLKHVRYILSTF